MEKKYEGVAPDGKTFTFMAPAGATPEQLQQYADRAYKAMMAREPRPATQEPAQREDYIAQDSPPAERPQEPPSEARQKVSQAMEFAAQETGMTPEQLIGVLGGAAMSLPEQKVFSPIGAIEKGIRGGVEAMRPAAPPAPTGPLSIPTDQQTRILQGTTDAGATGRARMQGFNIETAQAAARAKQAEDMIAALQQRGAVGATAPQVLAQAPGMTSSPSGVVYPRNITPPPMPIAAPPKPTPLDEATQMLRNMAEKGTQAAKFIGGAARAMPIVSYPLAGYSIGSDIGAMREQAAQPEPDYIDMLLRGMGAVGTGLSLHPVTAPVGVPMAVASPLALAARRNIMAQPKDPKISYEEMVEATRPSFRYAAPGRRRRVE